MVEQFLAHEVEEAWEALAAAQVDLMKAAQTGTHGEMAFARDNLDVAVRRVRQSIVAESNHAFAQANPDEAPTGGRSPLRREVTIEYMTATGIPREQAEKLVDADAD